MKVIYTDKPGNEPGVCYRLLGEFFGVISAAKEVVVEGDKPGIIAAYERAGIAVTGPTEDQPETDPLKMKAVELKAYLAGKGIEFDAAAKKEDLLALVPKE